MLNTTTGSRVMNTSHQYRCSQQWINEYLEGYFATETQVAVSATDISDDLDNWFLDQIELLETEIH